MYVKKIVAKNFIVPGVQKFEFDRLGGLVDGAFFNLDVIDKINEVITGGWVDSTLSFEKFYPKFSYPSPDMSMELDALIHLNEFEIEELSRILQSNGYGETTQDDWFYTIKCYYPFIFPIVTLSPAKMDGERDKNRMIGIGNHYEKFLRSNSTKRDLLSVSGFYCVSKMREEYYAYKTTKVDMEIRDLHNEYLKLLKSVFRYDEPFIKKIGKIFYTIDDGDVINYGDQMDFFGRHPEIVSWLDSIEILRKSPEIRQDFIKLLWDHLFSNLQIDYTIKTSNEVVEIKKILLDSHCIRPLDYRNISKLFKFTLSDEPLEIFNTSKKPNIDPKKERRIKIDEGINLDEDTMNLVDEFEDLTIRHDKIVEMVESEIKTDTRSKSTKMKKVKAKPNPAEIKKQKEAEAEIALAERQRREKERMIERQERNFRNNPKIIVIDSENATQELIKWD